MRKRSWIVVTAFIALSAAVSGILWAGEPAQPAKEAGVQHLVVKICNWDGVVPKAALDGFKMPAGKWADFQKDGWQVESYLVGPSDDAGKQGFYAVLKK